MTFASRAFPTPGSPSRHPDRIALEGRIDPGRVFDRVVGLDDVPDGYRSMNDREAIKVMIDL